MQDPSYFADKPLQFFNEVLGIKTWGRKQDYIPLSVAENKLTAVKACFTSGKTFVAGGIVPWYLYTHRPSIVLTTAPIFRQVEKQLWQEIARTYNNSKWELGGRLLQTELKLGDKWYAVGFASNDATNFHGFHEVNVLVVIDEAGGDIKDEIWEAIDNALSSPQAKCLVIGNPIDPLSEFARCFDVQSGWEYHPKRPKRAKKGGWSQITITAFDTPNVKAGKNIYPYLMAYDEPERVLRKCRSKEHPKYVFSIMAEFPQETTDSIIPLRYINAALDPGDDYPDHGKLARYKGYYETVFGKNKNWLKFTGPSVIGVDTARKGDDYAVVIKRELTESGDGGRFRIIERLAKTEVDTLAGKILRHARADKRVERIMIEMPDGGGHVDIIRSEEPRFKDTTFEFWPNGEATDKTFYDGLKIETLFDMKDDFEAGLCDIADEEFGEELAQDLSQFRSDVNKKGQYVTEDKKVMKKRIRRSPDLGDGTVTSCVEPKRKPSMKVLFSDGRPKPDARGLDEKYLLPSGKYSKNIRQHVEPEVWEKLLREGKVDGRR